MPFYSPIRGGLRLSDLLFFKMILSSKYIKIIYFYFLKIIF